MITKVISTARATFDVLINEVGVAFTTDEAESLISSLETDTDFILDVDGQEFRLIDEYSIRDIAQEEIAEVISECYLSTPDNKELPWWIEIDWNKTVQNCIDADGYGHHFSSYDGSEYEVAVDGVVRWYIFRTN